jgi:prophage tail gpP-like protein
MNKREADITIELTRPNGQVETIGRFISYQVNDNLFGASNFGIELPPSRANRALTKEAKGWAFQIFTDGSPQFSGLIDDRGTDTNTTATDLGLEGRDFRGLLMDSMIPVDRLSLYNRNLRELAERWTIEQWPEYITSVVTNNAANRFVVAGGAKTKKPSEHLSGHATGTTMEFTFPKKAKPKYKPFGKSSPLYAGTGSERIEQNKLKFGETVWNALTDLAAQIGAHIWMGADGSVIIARPDYTFDPGAYGEGVRFLWDHQNKKSIGGNVQGVNYQTSIMGRWSEYKVVGLGKSKKTARARELLLDGGIIKDPGPAFWEKLDASPWLGDRRLYKQGKIGGGNIQSIKRLTRLARRTMVQNALGGFSYSALLGGHYAPSNVLWVTDSTTRVEDTLNEITMPMYITQVSRGLSADRGGTTTLNFWPPDLWLHDSDDPSTNAADFYEHAAPRIFW